MVARMRHKCDEMTKSDDSDSSVHVFAAEVRLRHSQLFRCQPGVQNGKMNFS